MIRRRAGQEVRFDGVRQYILGEGQRSALLADMKNTRSLAWGKSVAIRAAAGRKSQCSKDVLV